MPAGKGRGESNPGRACVERTMAMLCRLREVPRHLLVCEKSNFGHDKSRHRHLVETHYHNYRVSPHPGPADRAPFRGRWRLGESRALLQGARPRLAEGRGGASPGMLGIVVSSLSRPVVCPASGLQVPGCTGAGRCSAVGGRCRVACA